MKELVRENIHIDVEPAMGFDNTEKGIIKICKGIKDQILRHIDDVAQVSITWDPCSVCSFCQYPWEVIEDLDDPECELGMPVCCLKAEEEWRKDKKIQKEQSPEKISSGKQKEE